MATNGAVAYIGTRRLELQNLDFPKFVLGPHGCVRG